MRHRTPSSARGAPSSQLHDLSGRAATLGLAVASSDERSMPQPVNRAECLRVTGGIWPEQGKSLCITSFNPLMAAFSSRRW